MKSLQHIMQPLTLASLLAASYFSLLSIARAQEDPKTETKTETQEKIPADRLLPWQTDLAAAQREAAAKRRPLFVRFGGAGCGWCKRLEEEIAKPAVQDELKRWSLVYLDVDKAPSEARRLGVGPIPALRILNSTGRLITHSDGYRDADDLAKWLTLQFAAADETPDASLLGTGEPNLAEILRLVRAFDDRDPLVREAAIRRLLPHPALARDHVVLALREGSLLKRLTAIELLTHWRAPLGGLDPWHPETLTNERLAAVDAWLKADIDPNLLATNKRKLTAEEQSSLHNELQKLLAATDTEAAVLRERIALLGEAALPLVVERLNETTTDADRERLTALRYRLVAAGDLALRWPGGLERLAATDVKTRHRAAEELSLLQDPNLQPLLLELFSDPDPLVREISLRGLQRIGGKRSTAALVKLLDDPDANVRAAVLKQLAEDAPADMVEMIGKYVAKETDADLVVHAVRYLREVKDPAALSHLTPLLAHESWQVRAEAAEGVGKLLSGGDSYNASPAKPDPAVLKKLFNLLNDPDAFVVSRALAALPRKFDKAGIDTLLQSAEKQPELAGPIVDKLIADYSSRDLVLPRLQPFLTHQQPTVRAAAVKVLVDLQKPETETLVTRALADSESTVRIAAMKALLQAINITRVSDEETLEEEIPLAPQPAASPSLLERVFDGLFGGGQPPAPKPAPPPPEPPKPVEEPKPAEPPKPVAEPKAPEETPQPPTSDKEPAKEEPATDRWLKQLYAGQFRPDWTNKLLPRVEELLGSETPEEQATAAVLLIPLGQREKGLPVLRKVAVAHDIGFQLADQALNWLPSEARLELFRYLREHAQNDAQLSLLLSPGESPGKDLLPEIWQVIDHPKASKDLAAGGDYVLKRIYFGERYYSPNEYTSKQKQAAIADLREQVKTGRLPKRMLAVNLLLSLDSAAVKELAEGWLADKEIPAELRVDAFPLLLLSLSPGEREERAIEALAEAQPEQALVALQMLSSGVSSLTTLPGSKYEIELDSILLGAATESLQAESSNFKPIIPQAPKRLKAEHVQPLLTSDDPQIAARAGYLLALLDDPAGLPPLLAYWKQHEVDASLDRLVYRAIAITDDAAYLPVLRTIYARLSEDEKSEFYWTIRIMGGAEMLQFREQIRKEVGMESLRNSPGSFPF